MAGSAFAEVAARWPAEPAPRLDRWVRGGPGPARHDRGAGAVATGVPIGRHRRPAPGAPSRPGRWPPPAGPGRRLPGRGAAPRPVASTLGPVGATIGANAERLGRVEYSGYQQKARLPRVPGRGPPDGPGGRRPGVRTDHVGVRPLPLNRFGTTMSPDAAARTGPTAASTRWRGSCSSRRRPPPSTSSTRASCPTAPRMPWSASPTGASTSPSGSEHLQLLGVRYLLASSPEVQKAAAADPAATLVARPARGAPRTTGRRSTPRGRCTGSGSSLVVPLANRPVVWAG